MVLVKLRSNLVNTSQIFPKLEKCAPGYILRTFWCIWASFGLNSAQPGYLVLCGDTQENLGVKIGLWRLSLLCLVFFGTKSVEQRINYSIFVHSDFLGFRAHPWILWKIFLGLRVTLCRTCWLSIGWHMSQKFKVGFKFLAWSKGCYVSKTDFGFLSKLHFFLPLLSLLFLLKSLNSEVRLPFRLFHFFLTVEMWVFFFFFVYLFFGFCLFIIIIFVLMHVAMYIVLMGAEFLKRIG